MCQGLYSLVLLGFACNEFWRTLTTSIHVPLSGPDFEGVRHPLTPAFVIASVCAVLDNLV
jgi:hypothetical protein